MLICDDINRNIKDFIMILSSKQPISFETWHFRVYDEAQKKIENKLCIILRQYYKKNNIKIKDNTGFYDNYISIHIAYAIISKMINPEYQFSLINNIPVDTVFYSKPTLDSTNVDHFIESFYTFPNVIIDPKTTNKVEHELLDKKMEILIVKTIETLNIDEIIQASHDNFVSLTTSKQDEKESLFRKNIV